MVITSTSSNGTSGAATTTVTNTTTTYYNFNPTATSYITSRQGGQFTSAFIQALTSGLAQCSSGYPSTQTITLVYSNGQLVDISSSSPFFGPIYFITPSGQPLTTQQLSCIQQLLNNLSQYNINYYTAGQTITTTTVSDGYCASWTTSSGGAQICSGCVNRYYLNGATGRCTMVRSACNTYDTNGNCTSCYQGYSLSAGDCYVVIN